MPAIRSSLEKVMAWQHQQYLLAAAKLGDMFRDCAPPDVWTGSPLVGELLRELWQSYLALLESQDSSQSRLTVSMGIPDGLWDDLKPYHTRLAALEIYQVDYPEAVEYLVPPVSVILSVGNEFPPDSEDFRQRVLRVALCLARSSLS